MVNLLDCTTRDGGYEVNWEFDDSFVFEYINYLNTIESMKYYEIGYRNHYDSADKGRFYQCSSEFLKSFYSVKNRILIGVMTDVRRYSPDDFCGIESDSIDFVRVATHPEDIVQAIQISESLFDKGYKVFLQLMDISNVDINGYIELYNWKRKNILEAIYIADSYSVLTPLEVSGYINKLKTIGFRKIGFHGHNHINLAIENTLEAIKSGAFSVDVTRDGIGRNGGNLSLLALLKCFDSGDL